ncbi:hypothetical protein ACSBR2_000343 [Camellia fascicularis]
MELPYCTIKVHRLMCLELKKCIDKISQIFSSIESARPGCQSGMKVLCSLHLAMERANSLILHCSESSKLYLAITGYKILLRCEKIRNTLESCLSQIQNMVHPVMAAQISRIVDDLKAATFTLESSEDEAGIVLLTLIHQDRAASDSANISELKALKLAALRLHITSQMAILIEKRSLRKLLSKNHDTDPNREKILKYLLYLLSKYEKSIRGYQTASIVSQDDDSLSQSIEPVPNVENSGGRSQVDVFDTPEPPEEFKCPLSARLMYDPVIIANGQTFERVWIEKWFNEGHETCPKTCVKLQDLSVTPNSAIKDTISRWCTNQGITIPEPCSQPTSGGRCLHKIPSSSSIASFGSSVNGLRLQISNVSLCSTDTFDSLDACTEDDGGLGIDLLQRNSDPCKFQSDINAHGVNLALLSELAALPWSSQCKAVEDVKNQLQDNNQGSHSMIFSSYIKPLIRFLKDAREQHDSKARRDGAQLLLTFLREIRNEMPPFQEDAIYELSSLLDSEITDEALAIMEVVSIQQHCKSTILKFGVLPSILRILEMHISKYHLFAMKVLYNLSENSDVGHHMVYLDYISKMAPFLGDRDLTGYCIKILRNLCNIEEGRDAIAKSTVCIAFMEELLESGTDEEKELAVDVMLSLCDQCAEYCQLIIKERTFRSIEIISVSGSAKGKLIAKDLLQLLRDFTDGHPPQVSIPDNGFKLDISQDSVDRLKRKKAAKASGLLGRGISILSKTRH